MRVLLSAALLLTASCSALWSGDSIPNPRNCVVNPEACSSTEICDQERQVCVPYTDSVVLTEAEPKQIGRHVPLTQVELSGAGFQDGARVFLGSQQSEATVLRRLSEDRLLIQVPADATGCGPIAIRVVNPDGTSASAPALLRYVLTSLRPQIVQHLGSGGAAGTAVVIAKLNGDSLPDIAVASRGQQRIDVFDQGNGMFQSSRPAISIMSDLFDLAAAPLDKDALTELVVVPYFGQVRLYRGASASYAAPYQTLQSAIALNVTTADMDRDGYNDLIVGDGMANRVRVFLGARDGSGTVTEQSSAAACTDMQFSASGDLNHDGFPEVLLSCFTPGSIRVFKNDGSGNLSAGPEVVFSVGQSTGTTGVAVADMNGDGHPDLIAGTFGGASGGLVSVALGDGALGFTIPAGGAVAAFQPRQVRVADLDCDGDMDVVAAAESRAQITYLLNDGTGALTPQLLDLADSRGGVLSLAVADLNGDGLPDVVGGRSEASATVVLTGD